jgi:hypothetical protein
MAWPALLSLIPSVINGIANIGVKYMERKQVEAQGKVDLAKARVQGEIDLKKTQMQGDQEYDVKVAEQMETSWKDEWLTILLSIPAILCFIPGGAKYVADGFGALKDTPEWYQWAFLGMIIASFGLKSIVRPLLNKWFNGKDTSTTVESVEETQERMRRDQAARTTTPPTQSGSGH